MDGLTIRRNRSFSAVRYQGTGKAEKTAGSSAGRRGARTAAFTVSETLRQLMSRVSQAENRSRESRQALRTGEVVLAEVQDSLDRIAELVRQSANGEMPDRAALQAELEQLREEIDRMTGSAVVGERPLFLDEEMDIPAETEGLPRLFFNSGRQELLQALPDWLVKGLAQNTLSAEQLLAGLGLDENAGGAEILAAIAGSALETNAAAGYLATLYLGAVIAGLELSGAVDPGEALEGLRELLEKMAEGLTPDRALELLTEGAFAGLEDFQAQFLSGGAPDLQAFLMGLLLSDGGAALQSAPALLTLLAGMEGTNLELMMGLLTALEGAQAAGQAGPERAAAEGMEQTAGMETGAGQVSVLQLGEVRVTGRDLSGVSFDASAGTLTVSGEADVTVQGADRELRTILVTGSGVVTLQNVDGVVLSAETAEARIFSMGENWLDQIRLGEGTALTLDGSGLLWAGRLDAGASNVLRVTGGAVVLEEREKGGQEEGKQEALALPVLVDGPASLAVRTDRVSSPDGVPLKPFDIVWKAFLPGWSSIASMTADGRQVRMSLLGGDSPDPARLWLDRGDHGSPVHTLVIRGRDASGQPKTRYAYLLWNRYAEEFQEVTMYPNPFVVTGGEQDRDWTYEEASQTLRILSGQVTAVSGGSGTDANRQLFSGRLALADGLGAVELTLDGVVCRVSAGRAFDLGRGNDVTLILQQGTHNIFHSGAGFAGISLGDGTSLCIDCAASRGESEEPAGALTATGGAGGAGIGRDSGASRDQTSRILIRGGTVTAAGTGGGAGIGAGQRGRMGSITITGGTVTSTGGSGGGAGIGGALDAPAGDIKIRGGAVTAVATYHAAAIGAGVQGECGDIQITGTAQIVKAVGGNPGADIGACLFGRCGRVWVSGGADLGNARLWTQKGVDLHMGEDTVTLPQFPLSSRALHLNRVRVSTREYAQAAGAVLEADRRWVAQLQAAYHGLYSRLEQSFSGLNGVRQYISVTEGLVRDTGAAGALLQDMSRSILGQSSQAMHTHSGQGMEDVRQLLR